MSLTRFRPLPSRLLAVLVAAPALAAAQQPTADSTHARSGPRSQWLGIGVTNLSNALYAEFTNVSFFRPEPGRSVFLTYNVTF